MNFPNDPYFGAGGHNGDKIAQNCKNVTSEGLKMTKCSIFPKICLLNAWKSTEV